MQYNIAIRNNISTLWRKRTLSKTFYEIAALILLCLVLFSYLQISPVIIDPDTFYHAKMTLLLKDGNLVTSFPWAYFTVLNETYIDHHLLFHVMLVPFVTFFDPLIGMKVAGVILAILTILTFYYVLKRIGIKYALFYSLALMTVGPFIFRMSLGKTPPISIIFLLFILLAIIKKRYILLGVLSYLYVLTYGMWPLAICIVLIYIFATWVINYIYTSTSTQYKTECRKLLTYTLTGIIAGIIINPYFPQNIKFYRYLFEIGIVPYDKVFKVGSEWASYDFMNIMASGAIVTSLALIAIIFFLVNIIGNGKSQQINPVEKNENTISLSLFLMMLFFLFLTSTSVRHIEYLIPFALLFSAYVLSATCRYPINEFISWIAKSYKKNHCLILVTSWLLATVVIIMITKNVILTKSYLGSGKNMYHARNIATWLKNNTPKKSIIFNSDFSNMPYLFYWNHDNHYVVGLDPVFMHQYDASLRQEWQNIIDGKIIDSLDAIIKKDFQSDYVVIMKPQKQFKENIINNKKFKLIYHDDADGGVYQIL